MLVRHATDIQPGKVVRITAHPAAEALLEAVYRKVLAAGGLPIVNCRPESLNEAFYELANEEQLDWQNPIAQHEIELVDATINIGACNNLRALDKFDPAITQRAARAISVGVILYLRMCFRLRREMTSKPQGHLTAPSASDTRRMI